MPMFYPPNQLVAPVVTAPETITGTTDVVELTINSLNGQTSDLLQMNRAGGTNGNVLRVDNAGNFRTHQQVFFDNGTGIWTQQPGDTSQIIFNGVANAVNQISLTNAATGNGPIIAATGTDTAIDLVLNSKSTGHVNIGPASASVALGGGSAPTLGTIGGSGPTTAAQNSWLAIKINGTLSFLPVWR